MKMKIRKGDIVRAITGEGSHTKKEGKVLKVFPSKQTIIVAGINLRKRHTRPSSSNQQGGIIEREQPIHFSNVMIICSKCNEPTRIGIRVEENGARYRICKKCGAVIHERT